MRPVDPRCRHRNRSRRGSRPRRWSRPPAARSAAPRRTGSRTRRPPPRSGWSDWLPPSFRIRFMYLPERGSLGASETSWFQALWSSAEGASAAPVKSGKTEHPPTDGAACAGPDPQARSAPAATASTGHRPALPAASIGPMRGLSGACPGGLTCMDVVSAHDRRLRPLPGREAAARRPARHRAGGQSGEGRRRLRLARPPRARRRRARPHRRRVRAPRARRRGRQGIPPAPEARGLRRLLFHRPAPGSLRRRSGRSATSARSTSSPAPAT